MASISRFHPAYGRLISQRTSLVSAPMRRAQTQFDSLKLFPVCKAGITLKVQNSRCSVSALDSASSRSILFLSLCFITMNGFSDLTPSESKPSLSHLAPLEAILFDVDGTLCDSDPIHLIAFQELLQQIGFNNGVPIDEKFFIANIAGKHNSEIALGLFPDDVARGLTFCDEKEALFRKLVAEKVKPLDGLLKLTKWIEDRGLKRAAVTNAPKENAELIISKLGLTDFFQAVILGSECEFPKPHPGPYLKALEVLNVSKEHTLVFEDSVSGIKAGVAAGMPVVGLTTGNPASVLMQAKPAFLIENYADPKLLGVLEELDNKKSS